MLKPQELKLYNGDLVHVEGKVLQTSDGTLVVQFPNGAGVFEVVITGILPIVKHIPNFSVDQPVRLTRLSAGGESGVIKYASPSATQFAILKDNGDLVIASKFDLEHA